MLNYELSESTNTIFVDSDAFVVLNRTSTTFGFFRLTHT